MFKFTRQEIIKDTYSQAPLFDVAVRGGKYPKGKHMAIHNLRKQAQRKYGDLEWVMSATAKDTSRVILTVPHWVDGKTIAADGFRLHIVNAKVPKIPKIKKPYNLFDYTRVIPDTTDNPKIEVNSQELIYALTACGTFARSMMSRVKIEANDSTVVVSASSPEDGDARIELEATTTGIINTHANYQFLIDALKGMDETITLSQGNDTFPMVLEDKKRRAIIMPMRVKE